MSLLRSLSPYLRKSAFICGLSRRRTSASSVESLCGGGFVCCSRPFAVPFCGDFWLASLLCVFVPLCEIFPLLARLLGESETKCNSWAQVGLRDELASVVLDNRAADRETQA